jgi:hypothetical protein
MELSFLHTAAGQLRILTGFPIKSDCTIGHREGFEFHADHPQGAGDLPAQLKLLVEPNLPGDSDLIR